MVDIGRNKNSIPLGDCVIDATADQSGRAFQYVDHVFPLVDVPAGIRVANGAGKHWVVVQHHVVGSAVHASDQHVTRIPV